MLLEFKMKNFKSFRNLVEFKMMPAQKIKDLEYSLLKEEANGKEEKSTIIICYIWTKLIRKNKLNRWFTSI